MALVKSNVNYQRTVFISQILEDNLILLADLIPHCICNAMTYTSGHISGLNMFMICNNFLEKAKKTNKTKKNEGFNRIRAVLKGMRMCDEILLLV